MLKKITRGNFRRFGWVIEYPKKGLKGKTRNLWKIILTETKPSGWRIAYLVVRDKKIRRLEQHPLTFESFEPVKGRAVLFAADRRDTGCIECFVLDKPVIFKKGIWHGIVALDDEAEIKITENAKVSCRYWPLGFALGPKI